MLVKLIIAGYCILIIAIFANTFANTIGLCTWYDLWLNAIEKGIIKAILSNNVFELIWLFLIYPIILALGGFLGQIIYSNIIKL